MNGDVVARAKAALEGVPGGPWTVDCEDGEPIIHEAHHYDSTDDWYDVDGANGGWIAHCEDLRTAEFIAAAWSLVPDLVSEVEELRLALTSDPTLWRESLTARQDIREEFYAVVIEENAELRAEVERLRARETKLREQHVLKIGWLSNEIYCGGCGRGSTHPCSVLAVFDGEGGL